MINTLIALHFVIGAFLAIFVFAPAMNDAWKEHASFHGDNNGSSTVVGIMAVVVMSVMWELTLTMMVIGAVLQEQNYD